VLNRGRKRAPNLCAGDRIIAGLCALFMRRTAAEFETKLLDFQHYYTVMAIARVLGWKDACGPLLPDRCHQ